MKSFGLLVGALAFAVTADKAAAQSYPIKPIRMIVAFSPGGGADVTGRMVGQKLSEGYGQPVIVENRPGANGAIGVERLLAAPADGYALLVTSSSLTLSPALVANLPYDVERDLAPVSMLTSQPFVLVVHPAVAARNVRELIALARSRPGAMNFGSTGVGGASHLAGELLNSMADVKITHVPYKGGADNVVATASGQIEMSFSSIPSALPFLKNERLRPLAVTSLNRVASMPDIPSVNESGVPGYESTSWFGVFAHAKVAREIVVKLRDALAKIVNSAEIRDAFGKQGVEPAGTTPEQFAATVRKELAQNAKLVKFIGLKPE